MHETVNIGVTRELYYSQSSGHAALIALRFPATIAGVKPSFWIMRIRIQLSVCLPTNLRGKAALSLALQCLRASAALGVDVGYGPVQLGTLPAHWITGGPKWMEGQGWQVHESNPDFRILGEAGCIHFEKQPFPDHRAHCTPVVAMDQTECR